MYFAEGFTLIHIGEKKLNRRVLGFDDERILALYKKAVASKKYESVLRFSGKQEKHYALNDQKEYFCEMSEAYFGTNDFCPFVQAELKEFDPEMYNLLIDIWGPPSRK